MRRRRFYKLCPRKKKTRTKEIDARVFFAFLICALFSFSRHFTNVVVAKYGENKKSFIIRSAGFLLSFPKIKLSVVFVEEEYFVWMTTRKYSLRMRKFVKFELYILPEDGFFIFYYFFKESSVYFVYHFLSLCFILKRFITH